MDGSPPVSREAMRQRLIYRVQEMAYGGLRRETRERLENPARRPNASAERRLAGPAPGTVIQRVWRDETYEVTVRPDGFECRGRLYRSLSAAAKAITGQHLSGNAFFGLVQKKSKGDAP